MNLYLTILASGSGDPTVVRLGTWPADFLVDPHGRGGPDERLGDLIQAVDNRFLMPAKRLRRIALSISLPN